MKSPARRPAAVAKRTSLSLAQRFKQRIVSNYCVRFHMSLIVMAVVASGVLSSKAMLAVGVHSLWLRYPIAVLCAYGVFLGMVRLWIAYVTVRHGTVNVDGETSASASDSGSGFDVGSVELPGGSGGGWVKFGGGDAGGAGASDSWGIAAQELQAAADAPASASSAVEIPSTSGGSSWLPDLNFDFDLGEDGWWIVLLLAILALVIFCAGGYLVYAAPDILGEAAWQALLGGVLVRARQHTRAGWMGGVLKSTAIPFVVVLLAASVLGWQAHQHCPKATRLAEVLACAAD